MGSSSSGGSDPQPVVAQGREEAVVDKAFTCRFGDALSVLCASRSQR